mmetsp:Transcript_1645/g.2454  ORF Transcript_1645/g.2454 Transcript_1645/m.2454 type:complete len:367 (+) Transcript_1645:3-1103(+)
MPLNNEYIELFGRTFRETENTNDRSEESFLSHKEILDNDTIQNTFDTVDSKITAENHEHPTCRTLVAKNLPFDICNEHYLKQIFCLGDMENIQDINIPRNNIGKAIGYAYILYSRNELAFKASNMKKLEIMGRQIYLDLLGSSKNKNKNERYYQSNGNEENDKNLEIKRCFMCMGFCLPRKCNEKSQNSFCIVCAKYGHKLGDCPTQDNCAFCIYYESNPSNKKRRCTHLAQREVSVFCQICFLKNCLGNEICQMGNGVNKKPTIDKIPHNVRNNREKEKYLSKSKKNAKCGSCGKYGHYLCVEKIKHNNNISCMNCGKIHHSISSCKQISDIQETFSQGQNYPRRRSTSQNRYQRDLKHSSYRNR